MADARQIGVRRRQAYVREQEWARIPVDESGRGTAGDRSRHKMGASPHAAARQWNSRDSDPLHFRSESQRGVSDTSP